MFFWKCIFEQKETKETKKGKYKNAQPHEHLAETGTSFEPNMGGAAIQAKMFESWGHLTLCYLCCLLFKMS